MKRKTIRCLFCKTLIGVKVKNKKYVCDNCDQEIINIMVGENRTRNSAEGVYSAIKTKERRIKKSLARKLKKKIYTKEYIDYQTYLMTEHWANVKERFKKSKLYTGECYCCGSTEHLCLHHKTYENIQKECLRDLVLVCKVCHDRIHKILKNKDIDVPLEECHKILKNNIHQLR